MLHAIAWVCCAFSNVVQEHPFWREGKKVELSASSSWAESCSGGVGGRRQYWSAASNSRSYFSSVFSTSWISSEVMKKRKVTKSLRRRLHHHLCFSPEIISLRLALFDNLTWVELKWGDEKIQQHFWETFEYWLTTSSVSSPTWFSRDEIRSAAQHRSFED